MFIEINIKMREAEKGYFQGEVYLFCRETGEKREFTFTLSESESNQETWHLIVRRKEKIFVNVKELLDLVEDDFTQGQITLLRLMGLGLQETMRAIYENRSESEGLADEVAKLWEQFDIRSEIVAQDSREFEVEEPFEESNILQLFEDTK